MSQHATSGFTRRAVALWREVLAWHDSRPRAAMSSPRGWIWATLVAASFFWMSNPLVFVRVFDDSVTQTVTWTAVAVVLTLPWLRLPRVPWPWLAFLGLCVLSQLWTIDDASTDTSIVLYVTTAALGLVVAANCQPGVVCWGLGLGGVVVVALSVYAFDKGMWGALYDTGERLQVAGVGSNRNILAYTLVVSFSAALAIGTRPRIRSRIAWLLVVAINGYGLYLARSGTGFLTALAIILAAAGVVAWPRVRTMRRPVLAAWSVAVATLVGVVTTFVTVVLDKQFSTLSDRSPFWLAAIDSTLDRSPLIGSGWGAVWEHPWDLAPPNEVAQDIYDRAGYNLPHGHNFFVDVLPQLGLMGVALALAMVGFALHAVRRCGVRSGSADPMAGRLVLLVLVALLVSGITEPMLTVPLGWWALALVVALPHQVDVGPDRTIPQCTARRIAGGPDRPRRRRAVLSRAVR